MKKMGVAPLSFQRNTSAKHLVYKIYSYLLQGMKINKTNQVWALHMVYAPMAKGLSIWRMQLIRPVVGQ